MELVIKKVNQEYVLDTAAINRPLTPKPMNINHIIHALKTIKEEANNVNSLLIFMKTIQIIINYNPSYTTECNTISKAIYNNFEVAYEIYYTGIFEWLNQYSLIQLLNLLCIKKETSFLLLNSLSMCNDIVNYKGGGAFNNIHCIYKMFFNELKTYDIFLNALFD